MGARSGVATQQKREEERKKRFAPQLPGGHHSGRMKPPKAEKKMAEHYDWRQELDEKCWPGYEKKGMKTMFGKRYPNCVKKSKKKK